MAHVARNVFSLGALWLLSIASVSAATEAMPPTDKSAARGNLVVELRAAQTAPLLSQLQVDVTAADLKQAVSSLIKRTDDGVHGSMFIPPGAARNIHLRGLSSEGKILYEGSAVADVAAKPPNNIVIHLSQRGNLEPLAVSLASYAIQIEQRVDKKGGPLLRANVTDANGLPVQPAPGDISWGARWPPGSEGFPPFPPDKLEVKFPPVATAGPLVPIRLCAADGDVTFCTRGGICKTIKACVDPVVAIAAGGFHTCALRQSGILSCWGANSDGQLGSPVTSGCHIISSESTCTPSPKPVVCPTTSSCRFKQVTAGLRHTCAIDSNDRLWCWGNNASGQLGATTAGQTSVVHVASINGVLSVTAGDNFTCANTLSTTGQRRIMCWGANDRAQTGLPMIAGAIRNPANGAVTGFIPATPIRTPAITMFYPGNKLLVAGGTHACAVTTDGYMRCWGDNNNQQVANFLPIVPATITEFIPPPIPAGVTPATGSCNGCTTTPVSAAGHIVSGLGRSPLDLATAGGDTSCAVFTGGQTDCWGLHAATLPSSVVVTQISAGRGHVCAVTSTDSQCWGDNDWGQIGNGQAGDKLTRLIQASPVAVSTTTVFTQLAAGGTHTCGLTTTGTVQCWGRGLEGQLGTGAFMYQSVVPANSLL